MKVYLNEISGLWNAIDTLYMSKRSWTREREEHIKQLYAEHFDRWGMRIKEPNLELYDLLDKLFKWAPHHITMGRFLDFAFSVEGIHRGAQDDFDSHAARFDNRIIRSSTRLANYGIEKSDWYQGKILTMDEALAAMKIDMPEHFVDEHGNAFVRAPGGYVLESMEKNRDVTRGLLPLRIPSNFLVRCNCTEFAHIVKQRDKNSHAAPELRECVESMISQLEAQIPYLNREFFYRVEN